MTPAKLKDVAAFLCEPFRLFWLTAEGEWIRTPQTVSSDADLIVALLEEFARRGLYPQLQKHHRNWYFYCDVPQPNDYRALAPTILEALLAAVPEATP